MRSMFCIIALALLLVGCESKTSSKKPAENEIKQVIVIEEVATNDKQIFSYNNVWVDPERRKSGDFKMSVKEVNQYEEGF